MAVAHLCASVCAEAQSLRSESASPLPQVIPGGHFPALQGGLEAASCPEGLEVLATLTSVGGMCRNLGHQELTGSLFQALRE